jgi:hypothetical protein
MINLLVLKAIGQVYNKYLDEARKYEHTFNYKQASKYYEKAVNNFPTDPITINSAGDFFIKTSQFDLAIYCYERGQRFSGKNVDYTLKLAESYMRKGNLSHANAVMAAKINVYNDTHPLKYLFDKLQRDIAFQMRESKSSDDCIVYNLGDKVNTKFDEYFPSIHGNDEELIFTRKNNGVDEDFYRSIRDTNCIWQKVEDLGVPFNTPKNEGAHYISMDRNYLFYMRCGNDRVNEYTMGGCDLYLAYRIDTTWAESLPFGATINTPYFEGMPCLSSDNKTLYFVSDRPGGFGGKDIWKTHYQDGLWQIPENLGGVINTQFDELSPYLAIDDHTLYFSSNGHPGFGGFDLFVSRKLLNGEWSTPINLGKCINTASNEWSLTVHASGQKGYFASNKEGGYGGFDLYECELPIDLRPQPMSIVYGQTIDSLSQFLIPNAIIDFYDVESQKLLYKMLSNRGDASYVVPLPLQKKIARKVYGYGYQEYIDTLYFERQSSGNFEVSNVELLPEGFLENVLEYDMTRIHYVRNQIEVDSNIMQNLIEQILQFSDTGFSFQVYGYTDNSGTPFINEDLSYRRAYYIAEAMMKAGILPEKIEVRGWGDAYPIVDNDTEDNRYINRRVEIKIIGSERLFNQLEMWQH